MKLKINGLIDKPRWYNIKCKCSTKKDDVENQYPISECKHCKFQECEDSMPKESFIIDKQTIKEITIVRGQTHQDIIGWSF